MFRGYFLLAAAAAVASSNFARAQAHAQPVDVDAELFGAREGAVSVQISPSGRFVSYIAPARNGAAVAFIADVEAGTSRPFLNSGKAGERIRWCRFVTDQRLICRYTATRSDNGLLVGFSRLIAINADGSGAKQLGQQSSFYDAGLRQFDGSVLDWLPGQSGSVLMAREYVPEEGKTGTRFVKEKAGLGVDRVETNSLKVTPIEPPNSDASSYMTDGLGHVRLMELAGNDGQRLTGTFKYYYRTKESRNWLVLSDFVSPDQLQPLAIDAARDSLYALKPLGGRKALYRTRLTTPLAWELVASHPRVDIDDVVRSSNGHRVVGYTFAEDRRQTKYFDPDYQGLVAGLGKALSTLPIIQIEGANERGDKVLLFAGSDNDAGRYFLFDRTSKRLNEFLLVRPALEQKKLANVKAVTVSGADGAAIPAYLTVPVGKEAKNLPAVVLPHGGPNSRDEWGFDWLAQYLAAKGYAVLQPNYRGSAGFGDAWLVENGFKSWRTSIGDVTSSAKWLVSEGIADARRVAVVGWSYGGYAALQSAATDPSLFKAVVAIAPVTDLAMLKAEAKEYTNAQIVADFVGSGPHIAEGSPLRHAAAIKAPVLLVHGDMDQNVGVLESAKMEAALRSAGTPVEFLRYKDLDHQLDDSAARTEMLKKIGELLERTIGR